MPKVSQKGSTMPPSPIRKLVPYADAAKQRGVQIYHLNIGQPDIKTPQVVMDAVHDFNAEVLEYLPSQGSLSYRQKLCGYYESVGVKVRAQDIMVTTGGSEALYFGLFSCLDEGDEIIIPEPFYANYNGFSTAGGIHIKAIRAKIDDGFALPPIDEFERLITPRTKAILICNPNNPTGYLYSKAELERLRDIALRHDLFLFCDEVYREFCYDGTHHTSILSLDGLDQHAIVIDSISKRYSACGARLGALVSRNEAVIATALKFAQARLSPPTFSEVAAEAALRTPSSYFEEVKKEYTQRRDTLVEGLRSIEGVVCPNPGGAFYIMARLPIDDCDHFCQWMLESFSYQGATVMMAPGSGFYSQPEFGKKEVRIAYVLNETDLKAAVACLREGLKAYQNR
ncbi:MAG: pyridoxal phosphate-dependent aminotransferase [Sphingobacteriales bacterium]|nr:pyridoxal phosphate-dependent aminotransferase [Sphingobacteriales bacterium]